MFALICISTFHTSESEGVTVSLSAVAISSVKSVDETWIPRFFAKGDKESSLLDVLLSVTFFLLLVLVYQAKYFIHQLLVMQLCF